MSGPRPIRSVAILGGGIVGFTAARAFARALPQVAVTLIDTPPDPDALADHLPASLPAINPFHAWLGIGEADLLRDGIATHRLGTRFNHWSAEGGSWLHAYGDHGLPAGGIAFHQFWLRARMNGKALAFDRYSAAGALLRADKFVHPQPDSASPLSTHDYALRLDPARYRDMLRRDCRATIFIGAFGGIERRDDGGVATLVLDDGRRVDADLFVDCAGPKAPILSALDSAFEAWDAWLPCDRFLIGSMPPAGPVLSDIVTAIDCGWCWRDQGYAGLAYCSGLIGAGQAEAAFGHIVTNRVALRVGRRPHPWIRNVVAIGAAAVAVDPLESTNLSLAQGAIRRMIDLLPSRDCLDVEIGEYIRRSEQEAHRVRDFLALHYLRSGRTEGVFWQALESRDLPDSLAYTLDQFQTRSRLPFFEEELFDRDSWLAVLFGLGVMPNAPQPTAARIDPMQSDPAMAALAERLATLPGQLPLYDDYLVQIGARR